MLIFAVDSFNDLAGTNLAQHLPELGLTPVPHPNIINALPAINTRGQCSAWTGGGGTAVYSHMSSARDMTVMGDYTILSQPDADGSGLIARANVAAATFVLAQDFSASGRWQLQSFNAGTAGPITNCPTTQVPGETHRMELTVQGTTATLYDNGVQIGQQTAINNTTGTAAGLACNANSSATTGIYWTNFRASGFQPQPNRLILRQGPMYAEYTPAGTTTLSSLTVWIMPRNIVLKGQNADAAWAQLQTSGDPDLMF